MTATIVDITQATSRRHARNEQPAEGTRTFWRAYVRTGGTFGAGREGDRVEWHLANCEHPESVEAHCSQGQESFATRGQPEGHCLVNGVCGLCGERAAESQAPAQKRAA